MNKRTFVLLLILVLFSVPVVILLVAGVLLGGWFTAEPVAMENASLAENVPVTHQYTNESQGYSLYYPETYTVESHQGVDNFVIGSSMNHVDPRLHIMVSDATGATAESAADDLAKGLSGFDLERYALVIDGQEAQVIEGVPGQEISRVVFLVNDDRLYQLTFTHADESLGEKYAQMEQLFGIVTGSFQFIPVKGIATDGL